MAARIPACQRAGSLRDVMRLPEQDTAVRRGCFRPALGRFVTEKCEVSQRVSPPMSHSAATIMRDIATLRA